MITLFVRTIIIYLTVFAVVRLMGKRQISDMQPFDLVVTLLIADAASEPISETSMPLMYGIIPILALFLLHKSVAFLSLKSDGIRTLVCGKPVILISKGIVLENALRATSYTLGDLTEQLRIKDVFSISEVEYGILETNGSLSVLKKDEQKNAQQSQQGKGAKGNRNRPSVLLVADGKVRDKALAAVGMDADSLTNHLKALKIRDVSTVFFACLDSDGTLNIQTKLKKGESNPKLKSMKVGI